MCIGEKEEKRAINSSSRCELGHRIKIVSKTLRTLLREKSPSTPPQFERVMESIGISRRGVLLRGIGVNTLVSANIPSPQESSDSSHPLHNYIHTHTHENHQSHQHHLSHPLFMLDQC